MIDVWVVELDTPFTFPLISLLLWYLCNGTI